MSGHGLSTRVRDPAVEPPEERTAGDVEARPAAWTDAPSDGLAGHRSGVALGSGTHTVDLVYKPISVDAGLGISVLALVLVGVWLAYAIRARRRAAYLDRV